MVLQRGARWRVGNGDSIKIWQHSWLPRKHPPQLLSYPSSFMENAKVAMLIDGSTRQWNEELIGGIFASDEVAIIKNIPLGRIALEDVLIWPHSSNGRYSCKSGYRFLKEEAELSYKQQPSAPDTHLWKNLWSLQVPNKVRNLLWHACRDAIPTKANLVRIKIIEDPLRDRCHETHETPLHALWLCKEIDIVWEDSESWAYRRQLQVLSFKELLSWMIVQKQNVELFAMTMWLIWSQRN